MIDPYILLQARDSALIFLLIQYSQSLHFPDQIHDALLLQPDSRNFLRCEVERLFNVLDFFSRRRLLPSRVASVYWHTKLLANTGNRYAVSATLLRGPLFEIGVVSQAGVVPGVSTVSMTSLIQNRSPESRKKGPKPSTSTPNYDKLRQLTDRKQEVHPSSLFGYFPLFLLVFIMMNYYRTTLLRNKVYCHNNKTFMICLRINIFFNTF